MENRASSSILVSEIFRSIQGEGVNAGISSVFLRLAICNLHCWYCDTKYTWLYNEQLLNLVKREVANRGVTTMQDLKVYDQNAEIMTLPVEGVEEKILSFDCAHLVITGGEPLIQQGKLAILAQRLRTKNRNFFVEVETNGTISPSLDMARLVDLWNVSPKLELAGNGREASEKTSCIGAFKKLNAYFKFVISKETDIEECDCFVERNSIPEGKVILMPEGTYAERILETTKWLEKCCETRGYKLSSRLHILMYGNERGK